MNLDCHVHPKTEAEESGVYITMEKQGRLDHSIKPTKETYDQLQYAYERLNAALFGGELPNCLMTVFGGAIMDH